MWFQTGFIVCCDGRGGGFLPAMVMRLSAATSMMWFQTGFIYVVMVRAGGFLPAMVMRLSAATSMMWFLATDCVSFLLGSETSGRIPHQADSTSPRRTTNNQTQSLTQTFYSVNKWTGKCPLFKIINKSKQQNLNQKKQTFQISLRMVKYSRNF